MKKAIQYEQMRQSSRRVLVTSALLLIMLGFLPLPAFTDLTSYLPLHSFLEAVAVVVAAMVFTVGWYTYQGKADYRTVALACLFLGVAVLDFSHLLSYPGMPDYVTASGPDKTIDFWLAARSLGALALIAAVVLPVTRAPSTFRYGLLGMVALLVAGLHVLFLYFPHRVPDNFDASTGLTPFKVGFEYILVLVYGVAAYLLWQRSVASQRADTLLLSVSAAIMAFSELLFTRYMNLFDIYNVTGHLYKVVAYIYLYRALVVTGIVFPYQSVTTSRARFKATLDSIPDLMFELAPDGTIIDYHSDVSRPELLAPPESFIGRKMQEIIPDRTHETLRQACADIDASGKTSGHSYWLDRDDGVHWYEISGSRLAPENEEPRHLLLIRDVTERYRSDAELRIAATAFSSQEGIMITDTDLRILRVNAAFEHSTGYTQQEVLGKTPSMLQSGQHSREFYQNMWQAIMTSGRWHGEIWNRRKNGEVYPQSVTITAVRDQAGKITNYVGDYIDMSALKWAEEEISKLSYFDPVTGLINRTRALMLLEHSVKRSVQLQRFGALLMIDLDQFKVINDTLGHLAGDELLIKISERLQDLVRPMDNVARYGGDEFVVVLTALGEESRRAATTVQQVAQSILSGLEDTYHIQGSDYFSTCSIGITLFGEGAADTVELVKQVGIALFQAKDAGGNTICFFDPA
ncbi:MASE3 domain-containing protein [Pseudohongiella sp.]|uniref:GGDEF domain-containing protein n=1 Tax=marine sediment metagenome TaxID=412755 RepID=A0A0F9Z4J7_9ZZZZ|nr:MASE3 domain-containing protein [Pseudohongiella sp.]